DPVALAAAWLVAALVEVQRLEREQVAEADVGQPPPLARDEQREMREAWGEPPVGVDDRPRRQQRDVEAELCQQPREEPVELEAEAAAPVLDDLAVGVSGLDGHGVAEVAVERV